MAQPHPIPLETKPPQETEESKKRKRKDEDLREALQHNSSLAAYSLKLEFMAQENIRKLKSMKRLFRSHILPFARSLSRQGLKVPRWDSIDSDSDCEKKPKPS